MRTQFDFGRLWGFEQEPLDDDERSRAIGAVVAGISVLVGDGAGGRSRAVAIRLADTFDADVLAEAVDRLLAAGVSHVVDSGWTPGDLVEIVRRRGSLRQLPMLSDLLTNESARHPADRFSARWRDQLARLPRPDSPDLVSVSGLERALGVAGLLAYLPAIGVTIEPAGTGSGLDSKQLRRVRALLAKAESTDSTDEAEAFSAKAQELISRYALDRLVREPDRTGTATVGARRIWIDAPYVLAKASLIGEVADANRCRAVVSKSLGFCTAVGESTDLDAVELLATSLLVQANTAMVRHGRDSDGWGTSRTRSFRRSFLLAYAARIGERLRATTDAATEATGHSAELVPILRRRADRVDTVRDELFPKLGRQRATPISNGYGWAAGTAAADLARLDARRDVTAG